MEIRSPSFRKVQIIGAVTLAIAFLGAAGTAIADDKEDIKALIAEIRELRSRVQQLEQQKAPAAPVATTTAAGPEKKTAAAQELDDLTTDIQIAAPNGANTTVKGQTSGGTPSKSANGNLGGRYQNLIFSNTSVGGYASVEYSDFEDGHSNFDLHRFIVNVGSQLTDRLSFYSEIEFEHGGTLEANGHGEGEFTIADANGNGVIDAGEAEDIEVETFHRGERGEGEIALEQAWMKYDINENVGVRGGIILVPFGKYNLIHDDDLNMLTDRPIVARQITPTTWAETGVGFVGNARAGDEGSIYAEAYVMNGLKSNFEEGDDALREARGNFDEDNNGSKAVVGRFAYSPFLGTEFGLSGYHGEYNTESDTVTAGAFDWESRIGDLRLIGEAAYFSLERGFDEEGNLAPRKLWGMYAEADYFFWFGALNETFFGKGFEDPRFVAVFRYNRGDVDTREEGNLRQNGYVVGLTYRPVSSFLWKNEFQWNIGELERKNAEGYLTSLAIGF